MVQRTDDDGLVVVLELYPEKFEPWICHCYVARFGVQISFSVDCHTSSSALVTVPAEDGVAGECDCLVCVSAFEPSFRNDSNVNVISS